MLSGEALAQQTPNLSNFNPQRSYSDFGLDAEAPDEPTKNITSTEEWDQLWRVFDQDERIAIGANLTVEARSGGSLLPTAHHFTMTGKSASGERAVIKTRTPAGTDSRYYYSLVDLGIDDESEISIEDIDFQSEPIVKSGFAIHINNRSSNQGVTFKALNLTNLSFEGFSDKYVVALDADKQSPSRIGVENLSIDNIRFSNNKLDESSSSLFYSGAFAVDKLTIYNFSADRNSTKSSIASISYIKDATIDGLNIKSNQSERNGFILDGGQENSSAEITNVIFQGNSLGQGSALELQQFQHLTLQKSEFTDNATNGKGGALLIAPDGGAAVGGAPKDGMALVENVLFSGNQAQDAGGAVYSSANVHFSDTRFENNTARDGGAVYLRPETQSLNAVFTNVAMTGNNAQSGQGSAIYAEFQAGSGAENADIAIDVEALGKNIAWEGTDDASQTTIALQFISAYEGNSIDLGLYSDDADGQAGELQILGGISASSRYESSKGRSTISIGSSVAGDIHAASSVKLGGQSTFDKSTVNFDLRAGRLELLAGGDLRWTDATAGRLTAASGTEFALSLAEVDPLDADAHGASARIHLAGNALELREGSALTVQWNERLDSIPAVGSHWLILAEDATLSANSAPDVSIETDNWILDYAMQVADDAVLSQGVLQKDGTLAEGTQDNVYVGFSTKSTEAPIDPDEDIRSATNLTAHFAYSTIREVSRSMLHWRPVRNDAFWAIPQYLHDRRDRDDFGVGFDAHLSGITVGKDFSGDNGFWGAAFGYGYGSIHSLGGIAYTSGDAQSWWAGVYGQRNIGSWRFEGVAAYLCLDADQDQENTAADLHLNTKNDAVLLSGKAARIFVLDANAERTISATPSIGLEYVWLKQRDFNVRMNSGQTLLEGQAEDMSVFSVPLDVRFERDWAGSSGWRHNASMTIGGAFSFGDDTMSGDFEGPDGTAAAGWRLIPLDDCQGRVSAQYVLLHPSQDFSISAGAGYTFSSSRELLDLQAVIRYEW